MSTIWVAMIALFVALWHEFNRFPATGKSIIALQEKVESLEVENERLSSELGFLQTQMSRIEEHLDRLKDPEYHALLDEGDGFGLYWLEKQRENIK